GDPFGRGEIVRRRAAVDALRDAADAALKQPRERRPIDLAGSWVAAVTRLTDALSETSGRLSVEVGDNDRFITAMMNIGQTAWTVRDAVGTDMLLLTEAVTTRQPLSKSQRDQLITLLGRADGSWDSLMARARLEGGPASLKAAIATANHVYYGQDRGM